MKVTQFSIAIEHVDGEPAQRTSRWHVVCDVCSEDLSANYDYPVSIVRIKGHIPPTQYATFAKQFREAWDAARSTGRPIIIDREIERTDFSGELQRALLDHAKTCSKERA